MFKEEKIRYSKSNMNLNLFWIKQWLYLDRTLMVLPTVQQQYRWIGCHFQQYDIQNYNDTAPQCPSLSSYSTAYESEGGQGAGHSQPLRAKAMTCGMKIYSLENLQELCPNGQFHDPRNWLKTYKKTALSSVWDSLHWHPLKSALKKLLGVLKSQASKSTQLSWKSEAS